MGVTISCSIVPASFSRTRPIEVRDVVMISRMSPRIPGTMEFRLRSETAKSKVKGLKK